MTDIELLRHSAAHVMATAISRRQLNVEAELDNVAVFSSAKNASTQRRSYSAAGQ